MGIRGTIGSFIVHAGIIGLTAVYAPQDKGRQKTAVVVRERPAKKAPPPEEKKPEEQKPKPPPPKPKPAPAPDVQAKPAEAPPAEVPKKAPVDLGLVLANDGGGEDGGGRGVAIPVPRAPEEARPHAEETPKPKPPPAPKKAPAPAEAECSEEASKPSPTQKVEIEYTLEAREAGLEGRLVLRVFVLPDGTVERVEVVSGIGPALDDAAIAAVKQWRFQPATQCGRPVAGVYTLARRFELGD